MTSYCRMPLWRTERSRRDTPRSWRTCRVGGRARVLSSDAPAEGVRRRYGARVALRDPNGPSLTASPRQREPTLPQLLPPSLVVRHDAAHGLPVVAAVAAVQLDETAPAHTLGAFIGRFRKSEEAMPATVARTSCRVGARPSRSPSCATLSGYGSFHSRKNRSGVPSVPYTARSPPRPWRRSSRIAGVQPLQGGGEAAGEDGLLEARARDRGLRAGRRCSQATRATRPRGSPRGATRPSRSARGYLGGAGAGGLSGHQ